MNRLARCRWLWINFKVGGRTFVIDGNVYRHTSTIFTLFQENFLHVVIHYLNEKCMDIIFTGDININLLNCDQRTVDYLDWISSGGARQVVEAPTKYSSNFSFSWLIDHVYINLKIEKVNVNVVNYYISDPMPVVCERLKINYVIIGQCTCFQWSVCWYISK